MTINLNKTHSESGKLSTKKQNKLPLKKQNKKPLKNTVDKKVKIHHINCRGTLGKIEEIFQYMEENKPEILLITESKLDESILDASCVPPGFKIIRKDRSEKFKQKYNMTGLGGGIAILYKKEFNIEIFQKNKEDTEEILWVYVKGKKSFLLGLVYNTKYCKLMCDKKGESIFEKHIKEVSLMGCNTFVLGDFNIDLNEKCSKTKKLTNIFENYGFKELVKASTRKDPVSGRESALDHIWTNAKDVVNSGRVAGVSDHDGTFVSINLEKEIPKTKKITIRNFKNYNEKAFTDNLKENLEKSKINQYIEEKQPNEATEELINILKNTLDFHAPFKEIYPKEKNNYIPWYNEELRTKIKIRKELLKDSRTAGKNVFKDRLKKISNLISFLKKILKQKYITEELEKAGEDPKKIWKILNFLIGKNETHEKIEPEDLNQEKVNKYNNFFATIGQKIQEELDIDFNIQKEDIFDFPSFKFVNESDENIEKIIDSIKTNVATGIDSIPSKIIKESKTIIAPYLTKIINISFETKTFPDVLKKAIIKPIFKKDDKNDISNYRPISLLPVISKIFERATLNQLTKYFENYNLINGLQHAYRKYHGTVTCLFELLNEIYLQIDNKNKVAIVSLDLSKAFDTINHELLLKKLKNFNLNSDSIDFLQSYLSNRKQVTKFDDYTSTVEDVKSGVPQGSILGPFLFLCFVNDLPDIFKNVCKFMAYADDTQLLVYDKTLEGLKEKIESVINLAQNWYNKNGMKNNSSKSEILVVSTKKSDKIKINVLENGEQKIVKSKKWIKILGVYVDHILSWSKQINIVKKNATNVIRQIHRINKFLPLKLKMTLYNTLITPILNYADIIWGGCNKTHGKRLQVTQNFAARSILGKNKYDSGKAALRELNLLNLEQRRLVHESVFAHKALSEKLPKNIVKRFNNFRPKLVTRRNKLNKLNIPQHNLSKYKKSPIYRTITSWNKAPTNLPFGKIKSHKNGFQKYLLIENLANENLKNNHLLTPFKK